MNLCDQNLRILISTCVLSNASRIKILHKKFTGNLPIQFHGIQNSAIKFHETRKRNIFIASLIREYKETICGLVYVYILFVSISMKSTDHVGEQNSQITWMTADG